MRKPKRNPKVRVEYIRVFDEPDDAIIRDVKKAMREKFGGSDRKLYYGKATVEGRRTIFGFNGYAVDEMDMLKRTKRHAVRHYREFRGMNRYDCKK